MVTSSLIRIFSVVFLVVSGAVLNSRDAPAAESPKMIRQPVAGYVAPKPEGAADSEHTATLSPDGKLVAAIRGGKLTIYSVGEPQRLFTSEPGAIGRRAAAFSTDGTSLAFRGNEKYVEIVASRSGKTRLSLEIPARLEVVDALTFSPDGRQLAVSSGHLYHKNLRLFDTDTGKQLGMPLEDVDGAAYQLFFSADGKRLIANHYFKIYLVDAVSYRLTAKVAAKAPLAFFQDEQLYAVQEETGEIRGVTAEGVGQKRVGQLAEKVNLRAAISQRPVVMAIPQGKEISIRNFEGHELFRVVGADSPVTKVCLASDGRVLLVDRESAQIEIFRLE